MLLLFLLHSLFLCVVPTGGGQDQTLPPPPPPPPPPPTVEFDTLHMCYSLSVVLRQAGVCCPQEEKKNTN